MVKFDLQDALLFLLRAGPGTVNTLTTRLQTTLHMSGACGVMLSKLCSVQLVKATSCFFQGAERPTKVYELTDAGEAIVKQVTASIQQFLTAATTPPSPLPSPDPVTKQRVRAKAEADKRARSSFRSMHNRCRNPNSDVYAYYGGRGILVCDQWHSYKQFVADMGLPPAKGYTLDRIDGTKGYFPDNCRWATRSEQANNTKTNRRIEWKGETHTMAEWAQLTGISYRMLQKRLTTQGYTVEEAFTLPPHTHRKKKLQS